MRRKPHFQAAIDAGLATNKSWLGLTLASLVLGDNRAAEASVDEVLVREPHSLRGLIIKGDLLLGRDEQRQAVSHYNLVMRLAATLADIPPQLQQDLVRIQGRLEQISECFRRNCWTDFRREDIAVMHRARVLTVGWTCLWVRQSARTTLNPSRKAHAFYLPDMPYQPFYPSEELPWVKEVEAATDAKKLSYRLFSQAERRPLRLISTAGWNCRDKHPTRSRITITGRRPSSYVMAPKIRVVGWLPTVSALMDTLPLTAIKGFRRRCCSQNSSRVLGSIRIPGC